MLIGADKADEMNKIVREHYPVENLPEDLREGLEAGSTVRVVVEVENAPSATERLEAWAADFWSTDPEDRKPMSRDDLREQLGLLRMTDRPAVSVEEAVARVRALRDEWDDK
jgi:hypothetical protein